MPEPEDRNAHETTHSDAESSDGGASHRDAAGPRRGGGGTSPRLTPGGIFLLYLGAVVWVVLTQMVFGSLLPMHEAVLAVQIVGIFGGALWYSVLRGDERAQWPDLDRTGLDAKSATLLAVTVVVLGMGANTLMALTVDIGVEYLPAIEALVEAYEEQINALVLEARGIDWVLGIVGICIAAPVCEEVLFRGTLLPEQRRSMSVFASVAANGAFFGAFHLNPINFVPLAIVGAFLAHLVLLTESLWPPIFAHAVMNGFNGLVLPWLFPELGRGEVEPVALFEGGPYLSARLQFLVVVAILGVVAALLWRWLASMLRTSQREAMTA